MSRKRNRQLVSVWFILAITTNPCGVEADWSEYVILAGTHGDTSKENLSIEQISEWRVRDIKRRLARSHGYSAAELGAMLDKRELINALAFEEEKQRLRENEAQRRTNVKQGIVVAISCIVLTFCWPLIQVCGLFIPQDIGLTLPCSVPFKSDVFTWNCTLTEKD